MRAAAVPATIVSGSPMASRKRVAVAQRAKVDARRIGEQPQRERHLRLHSQRSRVRRGVDPAEALGSDDQAGRREGDGRRDQVRPPGLQGDEGEHDAGDGR
jgi:hypothetical protein